jgi:malonate transporter and related proteins
MSGAIVLALAPVAWLVALGWGLARSGFVSAAFWAQAERLCYYLLLPALFAEHLANARLQALPVAPLAFTLVGSTALVAAGLALSRPLVRVDGAAFTSVFQGAVRFNNYVGVAVAVALFGARGGALAAVCVAVIVPLVNLLCVAVFAYHGARRPGARALARQLLGNPLVLGCLLGLVMQVAGVALPPTLAPVVHALGAASMPLGLMCVGAALRFDAVRAWARPVAVASLCKFVALPVAAWGIGHALGLGGAALTVALLFQALPTSSASYLMARQLGGDAPLMAGITAIQTLAAMAAIPLVVGTLDAWPGLR